MSSVEIIRLRLSADHYRGLVGDVVEFVKVVVDTARHALVLGVEMHADGEQLLLDDGSRQEDLWGANLYPKKTGDAQIEYISLINIRPRQGNRSQTIQDPGVRTAVASVVRELLPLP